jgi:phosphoribosylanthranilate isomerase
LADPFLIKICGIKSEAILDAAIEAGADMVGFVHFARSPRHLEVDPIGELISLARGRAETCVLLVNPDNTLVAQVAALGPDWLQLHGPETPHRVAAIRDAAGVAILKACPIGSADDVAAVATYSECADRLLLDAKAPTEATRPGGLGTTFDWALLKALDPALSFMLSGGLTPANVGAAIQAVHPMGVDVSSGVESAPGVKDADLIRTFITNARSAAPS